jgi:hypothetical protein
LGFAEGIPVGRCFKCGRQGLADTLRLVFRCSWSKAKTYSQQVCSAFVPAQKEEVVTGELPEVKLPFHDTVATHLIPRQHFDYLANRDFDPYLIRQEWDLHFSLAVGEYPWSIIIPVHDENGRLVSWQSRDISTLRKQRYINLPGANQKKILYSLNRVPKEQQEVIVVEGVTDAWRMGAGTAVATFGMDWSRWQLMKLVERFCKVWVMPDNETGAITKGGELVDNLQALGTDAYLFPWWNVFAADDPGTLANTDVEKIKESLGF